VLRRVLFPDAEQVPLGEDAEAKLLIGDAALRSAFEDPTPHLTVAQSVDESTLAEVEREMRADLPIVSSVNEAALMVETATGWRVRERFAMSSPQGVTDAPGQ